MGDDSRELQARKYLEKHQIMELLGHLTSHLLFYQPSKGLAYPSAFCPTRLLTSSSSHPPGAPPTPPPPSPARTAASRLPEPFGAREGCGLQLDEYLLNGAFVPATGQAAAGLGQVGGLRLP